MVVIVPMFFLEHLIGEYDPPAIAHAEFYYGFVCTALAWQIVYLMMSRDPLRLRPMLIPAIIGKAGFAISVFVLFARGRLAARNIVLPSIDLLLAALFAWAYVALGVHARPDAH
jgi:cytochrome c oxidase subunit IV